MLRSSEEIARLTLDRRIAREEKKDKKKMKEKYAGNPAWTKGMPTPNPTGRPKGRKNSFSKRTRAQMRRIFEQTLYEIEIDSEKYTPNQRLKALELIGKFVVEEKKTIKKEVKRINSIEVTFRKEIGDSIPAENKQLNIEDAEEIEDYE